MEEENLLSCTPCGPESIGQRLLNAYRKRDLPAFKAALQSDPTPDVAVSCLQEASVANAVDYVKALLDAGVDPNVTDKKFMTPLMSAAEANNLEVLEVFLKRKQNVPNIAILSPKGDTILHFVVKKKENPANQEKCVRLILQHKKVDFVNKKNKIGHTAVLLVAKNCVDNADYLAVLKAFLEHPDIDLDSGKLMGSGAATGTARDILGRHFASVVLPPPVTDKKVDEDALIRMLGYGDDQMEVFCKEVENGVFNLEYNNGSYTMLQQACLRGHQKAVEVLLDAGASVWAMAPNSKYSPVCLASSHGHAEILRLLIDKCMGQVTWRTALGDTLTQEGDTPLVQLVRNWSNLGSGRDECLQLLLELPVDVNVKNCHGETALHYASVVGDRRLILELLKNGAYIGGENALNRLPITAITRDVLEEHLDECLESRGEQFDDNYEISFDYSCLVPPGKPQVNDAELLTTKKVDTEDGLEVTSRQQEVMLETAPLLYMSANPDLRPLLKHPVITSFLQLKWQRLAWIFGFNLACFVFFVFFITIHILWGNGRDRPAGNSSVATENGAGADTDVPDHTAWFTVVQVAATAFWLILVVREVFQFLVSPRRYFAANNKENYLELALIGTSAYMLFAPDNSLAGRFFASATILLCWGELILLIGRFPFMATYFEMLKRVSWNFFKFLAWYSILIVAFALSFYALFRDSDESDNLFANPITSVFKTVVMMTGEFDVSDIPFVEFPWFSHVVFVMFVFLIAIVLFNLLNGLAVSDTQAIKDDAELVGYVSRVKLVHYIERMVLGQSRRSCASWLRCRWLSRRVTLFPESTSYVGRARLYPKPVLSLTLSGEEDEKSSQEKVECSLAQDIIRAAEEVMAKKSRPSDMEQLRKAVEALERNGKETERMLKEILEVLKKK